jgi:long-chain fatty acid transport protein
MRKTLFALTTLAPLTAHAGGVFVGEAGTQAMERGGAFVAKADDPTAMSVNPAGLAKLARAQLYLGANLLNYSLSYKRAGVYPAQQRGPGEPAYVGTEYPTVENEATFQPIPYVAGGGMVGDLALAIGVFAPPGVPNREFPCVAGDEFCRMDESGAPAPQRYDVVDQHALVVYPSIAAAYRLHERVDIGARFSWGIASIEARNFPWSTANRTEDPLREADFDASVSDAFVPTFGAGVLIRPTDFLEVGAAYSYKSQVRAQGTGNARLGPEVLPGLQSQIVPKPDEMAECAPGGTTSALSTCIDFDMPQTFAAGVRWIFRDAAGGERGDVELDAKWENWAGASDDAITVDGQDMYTGVPLKTVYNRHGFQDVLAVRLGGAYRIDVARHDLTLRGGVAYDTAAAPVSWTRVDKDGRARTTIAAGAAYELDRWRFDLGVAFVIEGVQDVANVPVANPTVDNRVQPDPLQPSLPDDRAVYYPINAGRYDSGYFVGLAGVTAMF